MTRDVFDYCAKHSGFAKGVTDTDCWAQNGTDFQTSIFENRHCCVPSFHSMPIDRASDASLLLFPFNLWCGLTKLMSSAAVIRPTFLFSPGFMTAQRLG